MSSLLPRTGRAIGGPVEINEGLLDHLAARICVLVLNTATEIAADFAEACGRECVHPQDFEVALIACAHNFADDGEFWERVRSEETTRAVNEAMPLGDDESNEEDEINEEEDEDEDEESESESESDEEYSMAITSQTLSDEKRALMNTYKRYYWEWDQWTPEDPLKQSLRRIVNNLRLRFATDSAISLGR
jgi:Mg-chelatase subunit ChlI